MLASALVVFTLPAAAVVIYASLRPLWAGALHTHPAGPAQTYRAIAVRTVLFIATLQALIIVNISGVQWLQPIAPRAVVPEGNTLHLDRPGGLCGRCCRLLTSRQRNQADKQRDRGQGS